MFFIGGEYNYHSYFGVKNREIENYCKLEGVSLIDIKKALKRKSIISKIIRFFIF